MEYKGIAKVQHYVPQFILRNFGAKKKHHLYVFDKQYSRQFVTNAHNVACESRFYDFKFKNVLLTLEPSLSKIEDDAKPLFARILNEDSLSSLSAKERARLSIYFSIQFTRTRWFLELWKSLPTLLEKSLLKNEEDEQLLGNIKEYFRVPGKNEAIMEFTYMISNAPKNYAIHFSDKIWLLLKTDRKNPFIMGDNPLALQNQTDHGPYGNIGLAVRGIEIYFPLSPMRALALWCPSHKDMFLEAFSEINAMTQINPQLVAAKLPDSQIIEETISAIESGKPLRYRHDNVINFNSLQILYAERYVFSSIDNFSLAKEMIANNDNVRRGPRPRMG